MYGCPVVILPSQELNRVLLADDPGGERVCLTSVVVVVWIDDLWVGELWQWRWEERGEGGERGVMQICGGRWRKTL